jgi:hypothetical protein
MNMGGIVKDGISLILLLAGIGVVVTAYVWSFVLAYRISLSWFLGMLFIGVLLYPWFASRNLPKMRGNLKAMGIGLAAIIMSLVIKIVSA